MFFIGTFENANFYLEKFRFQSDIESATDTENPMKRVRLTSSANANFNAQDLSQNSAEITPSLQDFNRLEGSFFLTEDYKYFNNF